MSISGALANALSGLNAQSRSSEIVSSNVANALTEGFGRREIHLSPRWVGGSGVGVKVVGVSREVDGFVLGERWLAEAAVSRQDMISTYHTRLQNALGAPDDASSITMLISAFDTALTEAASRPDSTTRLQGVLNHAQTLTNKFNAVSDQLQTIRMNADGEIARQVQMLNDGLQRVHELNVAIRSHGAAGRDVNAFLDERQRAIDELTQIVPLRVANRDHGQVALYTSGGAVLLDGTPPDITFSQVGTITADMTVASGALSQIEISGRPVDVPGNGLLSGGSLEAAFSVRDVLAVSAQADLDALARNLMERFADPAMDATLAPTDPGLFTDNGLPFDPLDEMGLAGRLSVNALADPSRGGEIWRLRDGLNAVVEGLAGDATLLSAMHDKLNSPVTLASGQFAGTAGSMTALGGGLLSSVNANLRQSELQQTFAQTHRDTLLQIELRDGVDTDQEMQKLLIIEQAYSANARVVTTADEMLQTLLGL